MKSFAKILCFILLYSSAVGILYAGNSIIKKDSVNIAILKLDYQTYKYEGAHISYHDPCFDCDKDSLPFEVEYQKPGDIGFVKFKYSETGETVFSGDIIWMGIGKIKYPEKFEDFDDTDENKVPKPKDPRYYDFSNYAGLSKKDYKIKTDSVWNEIEHLKLVNSFNEHDYRVGFFCYSPSAGAQDPVNVKWIVFLYYGGESPSRIKDISNNPKFLKIFPNPTEKYIIIKVMKELPSDYKVKIYNLLGKNIYNSTLNSGYEKIDLSSYSKGVYILEISGPGYSEVEKVVIR